MNKQDPFIIIKNYRSKESQQRVTLRVLDQNSLGNRASKAHQIEYTFEDKENYILLDDEKDYMKKIPAPNQSELINYSEYDIHFD